MSSSPPPRNASPCPQRLFLVDPETETPPKRPRGEEGKREGRGLATRPFFGPLSEPTKAALLDEPGRASAAPAAQVSSGDSGPFSSCPASPAALKNQIFFKAAAGGSAPR